MTDPVTAARKSLDRAETQVEKRRDELAEAITDAVRSGEMLSKVALRARYTREHVRRLVRSRGVVPTQDRVPPPGRARAES